MLLEESMRLETTYVYKVEEYIFWGKRNFVVAVQAVACDNNNRRV